MRSVAIKRVALPVAVAILVASGWVASRQVVGAAGQAVTTTTHTRTYLGLDVRSLDAAVFPELAGNTRGGEREVLLRLLPAERGAPSRRCSRRPPRRRARPARQARRRLRTPATRS